VYPEFFQKPRFSSPRGERRYLRGEPRSFKGASIRRKGPGCIRVRFSKKGSYVGNLPKAPFTLVVSPQWPRVDFSSPSGTSRERYRSQPRGSLGSSRGGR